MERYSNNNLIGYLMTKILEYIINYWSLLLPFFLIYSIFNYAHNHTTTLPVYIYTTKTVRTNWNIFFSAKKQMLYDRYRLHSIVLYNILVFDIISSEIPKIPLITKILLYGYWVNWDEKWKKLVLNDKKL